MRIMPLVGAIAFLSPIMLTPAWALEDQRASSQFLPWILLCALLIWLIWYGDRRRRRQSLTKGTLIPRSIFNDLPSLVRAQVAKLPEDLQAAFLEEYRRKAKSSGVATLLWLCLGWHYAYLGKWGTQFLFWITLGGIFVWWCVDLFRVRGMVRDYNKDIGLD